MKAILTIKVQGGHTFDKDHLNCIKGLHNEVLIEIEHSDMLLRCLALRVISIFKDVLERWQIVNVISRFEKLVEMID